MSLDTQTSYYSKIIADNLHEIMKEKAISQKELTELCVGKISKGAISNILAGKSNISLPTLVKLSEAVGVSPAFLLDEHKRVSGNEFTIDHGENLITDPESKEFSGYLGEYHVYFVATEKSKKVKLLHGKMYVEPQNGKVTAKLILETGQVKSGGEAVTKEYVGRMVASRMMQAIYCLLEAPEIGELCFFLFHHFYLTHKDIATRMAVAITSSAGADKRPTMHRLCLTRNEVKPEAEEALIGQLLVNSSEILISEDQWNAFLKREDISEVFLKAISGIKKVKGTFFSLPEAVLQVSQLDEKQFSRELSLLRRYSVAFKNGKISAHTDELLFHLLEEG